MTKPEIIRSRAHARLTFQNAYEKLRDLAIEKANWKLMDRYNEWYLIYKFEAKAYNDCLEILGENEEETDEISKTVFKREMIRLYNQEK